MNRDSIHRWICAHTICVLIHVLRILTGNIDSSSSKLNVVNKPEVQELGNANMKVMYSSIVFL